MLERIESRLLPNRCRLCAATADDIDLCTGCLRDLPWILHGCEGCGLPLPSRDMVHCGRCLLEPPPFTSVTIPFAFAFPVDRVVLSAKFAGDLAAAALLGELLAHAVRSRDGAHPQALVPVPLHPSRLRERGYNQAAEIARAAGKRLGLPVLYTMCSRVRDTGPQSALPAGRRRRNLTSAFLAEVDGEYERLAVIDDVYTTGSTVREVTRAIKEASTGTAEVTVEVWCATRTPLKP